MLVLALLVPCAGGVVIAARLGSAAHAVALAVAALAQAMAKGQPALLVLDWPDAGQGHRRALAAAGRCARAGARPATARARRRHRAGGPGLDGIAAGGRPAANDDAYGPGDALLGILPAALGQGAARRFLAPGGGNGAMLAALEAADPARLVLLELGVLVLLGALLVAMRWERDAPRAMP